MNIWVTNYCYISHCLNSKLLLNIPETSFDLSSQWLIVIENHTGKLLNIQKASIYWISQQQAFIEYKSSKVLLNILVTNNKKMSCWDAFVEYSSCKILFNIQLGSFYCTSQWQHLTETSGFTFFAKYHTNNIPVIKCYWKSQWLLFWPKNGHKRIGT